MKFSTAIVSNYDRFEKKFDDSMGRELRRQQEKVNVQLHCKKSERKK